MHSQKYYPALDGLRAYSALGIMMMHILANSQFAPGGFVFGWLIPSFTHLVFLFMIVSSFATCCGYFEKITRDVQAIRQFYIKRVQKIWPFFAMVCLLECMISLDIGALCQTFANLTLCFGFIDKEISIIGVGWFLGVIAIFYMIYPLFCCLLCNKRLAWSAFAVAFLLNLVSGYYFDLGRTNFAFSFVYLMAGGLIYLYREELEDVSAKHRFLIFGLCAAAFVACYFCGFLTPINLVLYSLCLIGALGSKGWIMSNPLVHFISGISLEIYLCHMPVFKVLERLGVPARLGGGLLAYVVTCVLTALGAVCTATVFNRVMKAAQGRLRGKW